MSLWRVENIAAGDGMPDVIAINRKGQSFWIENKALEVWPARDGTKPLARAFERGQLTFMREWRDMGGLAFVLLRVGVEYWLLNPAHDLKEFTALELVERSVAIGKKNIIEYLEGIKA